MENWGRFQRLLDLGSDSNSPCCSCLALSLNPLGLQADPFHVAVASGVISAHHSFKYRIQRDCIGPSFAVRPQMRCDGTEITCPGRRVSPLPMLMRPCTLDPGVVPASPSDLGHGAAIVFWEESRGKWAEDTEGRRPAHDTFPPMLWINTYLKLFQIFNGAVHWIFL